MKNVKVKEVRELITPHPSLIGASAPAVQAAEAILRNPTTRAVCVVDKESKLLGIINIRRLLRHFLPQMFGEDILGRGMLENLFVGKAKDLILHPPVYVTEEDNLENAVKLMVENELDELPVVDKELKVIGELNILEILSVWLIKTQG
ncbi:MAG: CBS domain-containing protein [bacterium]